jgi:predicted ATP-dependent protease
MNLVVPWAELVALISAITGIPVQQSLAVTGSMNQHGEVQAVGGINEKIEGFFKVCASRGLTGMQGVIIPADNIRHLMLQQSVVDAVAAGQFRIYSTEHIDQVLALMLGQDALLIHEETRRVLRYFYDALNPEEEASRKPRSDFG